MSVETNSILIREEDRAVLVGGVTVAVFGALLVLSLAAEDEVRAGLRDLIWVILIVLALGGFLIFLHYRMTLTFTRDGVIYQGLFKRKNVAYRDLMTVHCSKRLISLYARDGWKKKNFQADIHHYPEVIELLKRNKVELIWN
ncbi:MAG: hypothetical protein PUE98_02430 [Galactobacillus timonensis]|uniref:hypothetical protein n=1 Tax=Galactobacillus timonensis TaxID=2041840 RepID=UPI002409699D|nr:hypothetical protein [Galactobacillus timonensis]MDD5851087.1 hypothetical protein [Galactobacillus timonensis]MDD6370528.1 hypothetical protein [Galactobacillus timonensis]MDD6599309.1 hypothetical protein [Galactobacillus timonensis]